MRLLVPLTAALVPLLILPGILTYFDVTPKIAFLLFGAALILLYRSETFRNVSAIAHTSIGRWWIALLGFTFAASAVTAALSTHPALSLNGSSWRRFGLISEFALVSFSLLASGWMAKTGENLRILLRFTTAAGALGALYGILQYFGFDPFQPATAYQAGEGRFTIVRPPGTLGHADYFATWMILVLFFSLALARLEELPRMRIAAVLTSALAAFAIALSGTRSALLGLLVGGIVYFLSARIRFRTRSIVVACGIASAFAIFFFSPPGEKLRARLHWSIEDLRGGARLLLWRDSLRMAAHRPLAGYGPETFATEFPRFQSVDLARAYPDFYHESPHNIFLDALTSRGILGLFPLLGLCGLAIFAAARLVLARKILGPPFAAALAGVLTAQQFTVLIVPTALYIYLLIAILVAANLKPVSPDRRPRFAGVYLPLACALALFLAIYAIRLLVADGAFKISERRIANNDAPGAAQAYRAVLRFEPSGDGCDLRYSREMQQLSLHAPVFSSSLLARQEALKAGIDAARTAEDRQNAWYNLATLFASANDAASVEHCLRNASAWAPNWFKPHWTLAQLLEATGHHPQAVLEAARAVELDGGHDPEVTETLTRLQNFSSRP